MPATQSKVIDNGLKLTILAAAATDPSAIVVADLSGGTDVHHQLAKDEDFPFTPNNKEYDAGSWSTGGETPMVRSTRVDYGVSALVLKAMNDDPDTVRALFTANAPLWAAYRMGAAETQDEDWAADDIVHYVPLNVGVITDDPKDEGVGTYRVHASFGGNGRVGVVAA